MSQQATTETTLSPFMTRDEVLRLACIAPATLYLWMNSGHFPSSIVLGPSRPNGKAGKAVWIREEVMAWLQAKLATPRTYVQPLAALGASQPA